MRTFVFWFSEIAWVLLVTQWSSFVDVECGYAFVRGVTIHINTYLLFYILFVLKTSPRITIYVLIHLFLCQLWVDSLE